MAGTARGNRREVIRIITKTLFPFNVGFLLLFDPLQFLAELAVGSDSIAVPDERERDDGDAKTEEGNKAARPVHPESMEHGLCSKRKNSTEDTSRAAGGGLSTRRQGFVGIGEIVEHGHENQQVAHTEGDAREKGDDPVNVG